MADRALKKSWLRDAAKAHPSNREQQLGWLEDKRQVYKTAMDEGDYEMNSSSFEGGSASGKRTISAKDNHDAILAAMEELEAQAGTSASSKAAVIIPRFNRILN